MEDSEKDRDKRVEELWKRLDPQRTGELDFKALQKGLRRIDHPLKNADGMLRDIIKVVDTNGDGKIQYEEFRVFIEAAERQLFTLFRSIDRNQDGKVGKDELRAAFQRAGLAVPSRRLAGFFDEIDVNHDGFISFEEWRDFLLFMPTHNGAALEAALSFYSSIVTLNAEGDSMVSDETLEGLGTTGFLVQALFGSLLAIAFPHSKPRRQLSAPPKQTTPTYPKSSPEDTNINAPEQPSSPSFPTRAKEAVTNNQGSQTAGLEATTESAARTRPANDTTAKHLGHVHQQAADSMMTTLTDLLPAPGYFVAGAISGGVSRTCTAPLDRLKVYLLVNTKSITSANVALEAAKGGHAVQALRSAARPIREAVVSLWKAGGVRTFFAGNGLNVVKIMPESAIRFGSYEASKRFLATYEGHGNPMQISTASKFVAGGLGGMTAQFCVYPIDTLKFRLQCETVKGGLQGNALLVRTAKAMWAEGGLRAAYRGLGLGLMGMFPYSAIDMGTFEFLKTTAIGYKARYYGVHEEDAPLGNMATAVLGASSGALGATVVYPLNVVRTRLQTQGTAMHPSTYTGVWDATRKTVKGEGLRGLYKGLTPNILKVAPALSITWVCYENTKGVLGLH